MNEVATRIVISLGGSILVPSEIDLEFLRSFTYCVRASIRGDQLSFVVVVGGGSVARNFQGAYRSLAASRVTEEEDWIGIEATRLNARLVKAVFGEDCPGPVITDPTTEDLPEGPVIVAAGWKPGFSTDYDAVVLAKRYASRMVINLSNIRQVYTEDPAKNNQARPLSQLSWKEFRAIVGSTWKPGAHAPFDPIAAKKASELGLRVVIINGRDLDNLVAVLSDAPFTGTVIEG